MRHTFVGAAALAALTIVVPVWAQSGSHDTGAPMGKKPAKGQTAGAAAPIPRPLTTQPSAAATRVWFLRISEPDQRHVGTSPFILANGARIAAVPADTVFYCDLAPGMYLFSVEDYGLPTGHAISVQLTPGAQVYLQVQRAAAWHMGSTSAREAFFVMHSSAQHIRAHWHSLTYLGQRCPP